MASLVGCDIVEIMMALLRSTINGHCTTINDNIPGSVIS